MNFIKISKDCLSLSDTLYSGQSFMWINHPVYRDIHIRILYGCPVFISSDNSGWSTITTETLRLGGRPVEEFFTDYFSLDLDARMAFPKNFPLIHPDLWKRLQGYFDVKVLRQEPFETMITFMCAQGIGMHLIRNQVSLLAKNYGKKFDLLIRDHPFTLYGFPSPSRLAACDPDELKTCTNNNRIRARNIIMASRAVMEGKIDFCELKDKGLPLEEVRRRLCLFEGIGYKIADCIALFGLGRFDAFPVDTHVRQFMAEWFGSSGTSLSLTPASYLRLDREARTILVPQLAGYAGHLLFHCWRKEVKKLRWF
jgi:N-glycosylase/DNA lyase